MAEQRKETRRKWCLHSGVLLLCLLLFPWSAAAGEPPKELLQATIHLVVKWDERDDGGNRRHGRINIDLKGQLQLNRQFSSLDQGLKQAVMLPYQLSAMNGTYRYEDTYEAANRNHCSNPAERYEGAGRLTIDPYPGPGNLMLHYMGKMSEQLVQFKTMAPSGAFDALIDRYLFGITLPEKEVNGTRTPDAQPCVPEEVKRNILGGDKIQVHFEFNDDGTMSGDQRWASDFDPGHAFASVSNLPPVFNAKPFEPDKAPGGEVSYELRWEIKEACVGRIWLEVEIQKGKNSWIDITDGEADITVGKQVRLKAVVLPRGKIKEPLGAWTLDGDGGGERAPYFKNYEADKHRGRVIELDPIADLEQKNIIALYWSGGTRGTVRMETQACGETLTAEATLKMKRPDYKVNVSARQESTIGPPYTGGVLDDDCMGAGAHGVAGQYHWWLQSDGITFDALQQDNGDMDGEVQWVQLIKQHNLWQKFDDNYHIHLYISDALDRCYPYQRGPAAMDRPGIALGQATNTSITEEHEWVSDEDEDNLRQTTLGTMMYTKAVQDCRMVLMFKPEGKEEETQWVPLQEIFWTWRADAGYSRAANWQIYESSISPAVPEAKDTDRFPEWEKNSADMKAYMVE